MSSSARVSAKDWRRAGFQQRLHDVHRLHVLVVTTDGDTLGVGQGHLEAGGEFVHAHEWRS